MNFRCTSCGYSNPLPEGARICKCKACGGLFTVPRRFDQLQNMYELALKERLERSFDRALTYYSRILKVDAAETEAQWGYLLSKYGVEVSQEAATYGEIFFHRVEHSDFTADPAYQKMLDSCPQEALYYYEGMSRRIGEAHRQLLELSRRTEQADIYLDCTSEAGSKDAMIALQVASSLRNAGYRVFLPCEIGIGKESQKNWLEMASAEKAQAMIVIATPDSPYEQARFQAAWKRFSAYHRQDAGRGLLTVYADMQPEQLPGELRPLQSIPYDGQNFQDTVLEQINRMFGRQNRDGNVTRKLLEFLRSGESLLEEQKFKEAMDAFTEARELDAESYQAYWGLVRAQTENLTVPCLSNELDNNYSHMLQYTSEQQREEVRRQLAALQSDAVWNALLSATNRLQNHRAAAEKKTKNLLKRVNLYFLKSDSRLQELEGYRRLCDYHKEKEEILNSYEHMDVIRHPSLAERQKLRTALSNCSRGDRRRQQDDLKAQLYILAALALVLISGALWVFRFAFPDPNYDRGILVILGTALRLGALALVGVWLFHLTMTIDPENIIPSLVPGSVAFCVLAVIFLVSRIISRNLAIGVELAVMLACFLGQTVVNILHNRAAMHHSAKAKTYKKQISQLDEQIQAEYRQEVRDLMARRHIENDTIPELSLDEAERQAAMALSYEDRINFLSGLSSSASRVPSSHPWLILSGTAAVMILVMVVFTNWIYAGPWHNITAISACGNHVVGLKEDGTVIARGLNANGECEVSGWKNMEKVYAGEGWTAGIQEDGTVLIAGTFRERSGAVTDAKELIGCWEGGFGVLCRDGSWRRMDGELVVQNIKKMHYTYIVDKSQGNTFLLALSEDGNVYMTEPKDAGWLDTAVEIAERYGSEEGALPVADVVGTQGALCFILEDGSLELMGVPVAGPRTEMLQWNANDYTQLYVVPKFAAGLRHDGTVELCTVDGSIKEAVSQWTEIVKLSGLDDHLVGLRKDGTVVTAGNNQFGQCDTEGWKHVTYITAAYNGTYGLRDNGTVYSACEPLYGQDYLRSRSPVGAIAFWLQQLH